MQKLERMKPVASTIEPISSNTMPMDIVFKDIYGLNLAAVAWLGTEPPFMNKRTP